MKRDMKQNIQNIMQYFIKKDIRFVISICFTIVAVRSEERRVGKECRL